MLLLSQFFAGILGMFLHAIVKISQINQRTPVTVTVGTIIRTYLRKDFPTLMLSVVGIFVQMIVYSSYMSLDVNDNIPFVPTKYQSIIQNVSLVLFVGVTYMIESIVMGFTGVSEKWIGKLVDKKDVDSK